MKILLDENFPVKLKSDFTGLDVFTVDEMNWKGKKNGELLFLMQQNEFDALVTIDKKLQYQQNLSKYNINIVILNLKDTREKFIKPFVPEIMKKLNSGKTGKVFEISG